MLKVGRFGQSFCLVPSQINYNKQAEHRNIGQSLMLCCACYIVQIGSMSNNLMPYCAIYDVPTTVLQNKLDASPTLNWRPGHLDHLTPRPGPSDA